MRTTDHSTNSGSHLTVQEIERCREQLSDLIIAPFDPAHAKGVGYNLSLSEMIYSITRSRLVPICRDAQETYFYLRPNETILALSYEYIKVTDRIAGSFHSRVRMTAQGVGSTSTTLDPGWKGMLLFSLNNPTKKKIKIVLSTRIDGTIRPNPVITLITWWLPKPDGSEADAADPLTLRLDNPPMRIDIWSELTAKPLRLFRNQHYQKFCRLVESLSPFESLPSAAVAWSNALSESLTALRIAVEAQGDETAIRTALIRLQAIPDLPGDMSKRLHALTAAQKRPDLLAFCRTPDYLKEIDAVVSEMQYQLLCDQVEQIHARIAAQVPISWHKSILANIWQQLLKNCGVLVATVFSIGFILYGHFAADSNYWAQLILAFVPLVGSIVYHLIAERK